MNAFKHGLATIQKRREEDVPIQHEENIRQQILDGYHPYFSEISIKTPSGSEN
jgi:hypothetical protein